MQSYSILNSLEFGEKTESIEKDENSFLTGEKVIPYSKLYEKFQERGQFNDRSGQWLLDKGSNDTLDELSNSKQITDVLEGIVKNKAISEASVNLTYGDTYISFRIVNNSPAGGVDSTLQRNFDLYKYYSLIWIICSMLIGIFITSGLSGSLGPLTSIVGVIMSLGGIIGAYLDWKDRVETDGK
ncbi:hypothetical protein DNHGIG_07830 [Collibacillus ludicampi]|uniref:Uncharacterized protein n=1 Tax=Collibacillus ludicampi TaxID=2771369 RepID=A0AAV4LC05_9BACL|nr:hypothetical protein [Collibacillus ludicampi]GIM45234.1 hypothetical protein DNHGIG_07830 [Collibacillus ludicampi]